MENNRWLADVNCCKQIQREEEGLPSSLVRNYSRYKGTIREFGLFSQFDHPFEVKSGG